LLVCLQSYREAKKMNRELKERLLGALVLIGLIVLFLPKLFKEPLTFNTTNFNTQTQVKWTNEQQSSPTQFLSLQEDIMYG